MTTTNEPAPTVSDNLAIALRRHGVEIIFGQSVPSVLFLSAARHGIRQITYRAENAGGAMADAYARVSGRIGVVAAQNGPAATLLVAPMAEALTSSVPMLVLVQDVPAANRDRNAFQEIDQLKLFDGCARWVRRLDDPARVDEYVDMAVAAATSGRGGPAVLLLPRDVLLMPATPKRTAAFGRFPLHRAMPPQDALAEAARLLAGAENPVVIAGGGIHLSDAYRELAELQAQACLPVATTMNGKGAVDENHSLSLGIFGHLMGRESASRFQRGFITDADVVLLAGTRTNEHDTDRWTLFPSGARYIHIDIDPVEATRNYESLALVGDAQTALRGLTAALAQQDLSLRRSRQDALRSRIAEGRRRHQEAVADLLTSEAHPLRPERVMAELESIVDGQTILAADASYSTLWVANYLRARKAGQRFVSPRGLAGLGWGLPFALGAQAARPDARVVCVTGDGGFGHVWAELETAAREGLPVITIVLNNSIFGYQKHAELVQYDAYTTAIDFGDVDHAMVARAAGVRGVRAGNAAELRSALKDAWDSGEPVLIEVITDPGAYPPITAWDGREQRILDDPGPTRPSHDG